MKDIFNSHPVSVLKKEISKTNIKGYSKMKKAQVVDLMIKNKSRFSHIKMADKSVKKKIIKKTPKTASPSPSPKKPSPSPKKSPSPSPSPSPSGPRFLGDIQRGDASDKWWLDNENKPKNKKLFTDYIDQELAKKGLTDETATLKQVQSAMKAAEKRIRQKINRLLKKESPSPKKSPSPKESPKKSPSPRKLTSDDYLKQPPNVPIAGEGFNHTPEDPFWNKYMKGEGTIGEDLLKVKMLSDPTPKQVYKYFSERLELLTELKRIVKASSSYNAGSSLSQMNSARIDFLMTKSRRETSFIRNIAQYIRKTKNGESDMIKKLTKEDKQKLISQSKRTNTYDLRLTKPKELGF